MCNTPKTKYQFSDTSTHPWLTPLITTLPIAPYGLPKTMELPPVGKGYLCFRLPENVLMLLNIPNQEY